MIRSLTVKNYKSFKNETTIDIKPITILVGPNSSGKSSIIKAFELLQQSSKNGSNRSFLHFGNDLDSFGNIKSISFLNNNDPITISFTIDAFSSKTLEGKSYFTIEKEELSPIKVELTLSDINELLSIKYNDWACRIHLEKGRSQYQRNLLNDIEEKKSIKLNLSDNENKYLQSLCNEPINEFIKKSFKEEYHSNTKGLNIERIDFDPMMMELKHLDIFDSITYSSKIEVPNRLTKLPIDEEWLKETVLFASNIELNDYAKKELATYYIWLKMVLENRKKYKKQSRDHENTYKKIVLPSLKEALLDLSIISPLRPFPQRFYSQSEYENIFGNDDIKKIEMYITSAFNFVGLDVSFIVEQLQSKINQDSVYSIFIQTSQEKPSNIVDSGFGISQLMPIIVGFKSYHNLIIQQPELHVHPNIQSKMANYFVKMIKDHSENLFSTFEQRSIIIETHSEHLIRGFQVQVAQGLLKPEEIAIYYV